ncbi:hypothetical protein Hanom_Chr07g00640251 [Helianthus anomalus]
MILEYMGQIYWVPARNISKVQCITLFKFSLKTKLNLETQYLFIANQNMSTVVSFFTPHIPLHKPQDHSKDTRTTTLCPEPTLTTKLTKRHLLKTVGISFIGSGALEHPAARAETGLPDTPVAATSSRISYSRFLDYINEGVVKKVDLFENGSVAIAEIVNPALDNKVQRVKVQLPGLQQELVRKLREKEVDFAAHPMEMNITTAVFDLLANFAFPLILLGALLLRSSSPNTPGGPNLPFGLGRYDQLTNNVRSLGVSIVSGQRVEFFNQNTTQLTLLSKCVKRVRGSNQDINVLIGLLAVAKLEISDRGAGSHRTKSYT